MDYLRSTHSVSKTRACGLLDLAVTTYRYQSTNSRPEQPLRAALRRHAQSRRRWGYRRLEILLRREGFEDNIKRIHRLYRAEGLQVRNRRRRKLTAALWTPYQVATSPALPRGRGTKRAVPGEHRRPRLTLSPAITRPPGERASGQRGAKW